MKFKCISMEIKLFIRKENIMQDIMNDTNRNIKYFSEELQKGIYLIGLDMGGIGVEGREIIPGHATSNSYLIVGKEKALLIDSMSDKPGFREFAEGIGKVPVMFALSHGHLDHIMRLREFDEFWIHNEDEELLRGAYGMPVYDEIPPKIHYLNHGDVIDLGERIVEVFHIKGHTKGSLLFLDRNTKTMISGDTIARRLLYGISGWVPIDEFVQAIKELDEQDFDGILSAHDRFILPKSHIQYMLHTIYKTIGTDKRIHLLNMEFIQAVSGNENEIAYQDVTIPTIYMDSLKNSIRNQKREK